MARNRFGLGIGIVLAVGMGIVACADDDPVDPGPSPDAGLEAARPDGGTTDAGQDSGEPDTGAKDAGKDADAYVPPQPGVVSDLAGAGETHVSVKITWTAPPDYTGKGTVARYDIRWSTTPITTEAELLAATAVATPPEPVAPGTEQTALIDGLTAETQYYVALRTQYDNDAYGPMSNVATVSTKARAKFLVSEIAPANSAAAGGDFVELVVTKAGFAGGLDVLSGYMMPLHTFAPLDVQVGDRFVIHASGLPGPAGFAQEDATKNKASSTAANASANVYDIYSAVTDLPIAVGSAAVSEPPPANGSLLSTPNLVQDLVPYADRSVASTDQFDPHLPYVYLFLVGDMDGSWPFALTQDEWTTLEDPCRIWVDAVNTSGDDAPACGGAGAGFSEGESIQRTGTTDTNTAADFTIAPHTRGLPN